MSYILTCLEAFIPPCLKEPWQRAWQQYVYDQARAKFCRNSRQCAKRTVLHGHFGEGFVEKFPFLMNLSNISLDKHIINQLNY